MLSRISGVLFVLYLTLLAVATPWGQPTTSSTPTKTITVTAPGPTVTEPASQCSTGPIQCCDSTEMASSANGAALLGLLGVVVQGIDALIGVNCSPITVVGVGSGNACSATTVCCQNNAVGGLISIGCVPVIL
ncbi:hydrophobin [Gelatoporia subvermispora B]|uniref:Hydrophobin n=1 Tax=Ceriporiopsis subvermispora (strain B) TaxID=914234 RepID=M2QWW8_CERS8|nr:hydrophobin [Gelatoporia subvermispora B]